MSIGLFPIPTLPLLNILTLVLVTPILTVLISTLPYLLPNSNVLTPTPATPLERASTINLFAPATWFALFAAI